MRYYPNEDTEFQLEKILNKGLEFEDNLRGTFVEFAATGGEQEIQHDLGYVPIGIIQILIDGDIRIWATRLSDWNTVTLFLESSAESPTVRLYVM